MPRKPTSPAATPGQADGAEQQPSLFNCGSHQSYDAAVPLARPLQSLWDPKSRVQQHLRKTIIQDSISHKQVECPFTDHIDNESDVSTNKINLLIQLKDQHRILSDLIVEASYTLAKLGNNCKEENKFDDINAIRVYINDLIDKREKITKQLSDLSKLIKSNKAPSSNRNDAGLAKIRYPNRDFFLADLFDYTLKDDGASMEAPIFSLSTKPDCSIWEWRSKDGKKYVKVIPSSIGRATQHDKDILIYVISQLVEGITRGRKDAQSRTIRFTVYDFLVTTNRQVSGQGYKLLHEAFERLRGTTITTDIRTGGERIRHGFGIIDEWRIIERSPTDERMVAVEVTLSRWLYNAVKAFEVLTIHPDYFRLRKPLARRIYEIARKHCGYKKEWTVGLDILQEKCGSRSSIREFRRALRKIQAEDVIPEYHYYITDDKTVTFRLREPQRLASEDASKRIKRSRREA